MVGPFFKVLLVVTAMLVANSDAVKCAVKGDFCSLQAEFAPLNVLFKASLDTDLNVVNQEDCDGREAICVQLSIKGSKKPIEVAGCQQLPPNHGLSGTVFITRTFEGPVTHSFIACRQKECNSFTHANHETLNSIRKTIDAEIGSINKNRSTDLQCHVNGKSAPCTGSCALSSSKPASCSSTSTNTPYYVQTFAVASTEKDKTSVKVLVFCATDNCNAPGAVGEKLWSKLNGKVKAETKKVIDDGRADVSFSNQPNGFVLVILISIISTIVKF